MESDHDRRSVTALLLLAEWTEVGPLVHMSTQAWNLVPGCVTIAADQVDATELT